MIIIRPSLLLLLLATGNALAAGPSGAFDVGDRTQLFVDRVLVRSAERICFTLHPGSKHPANPLLRADKRWEGWRLSIYGSVLYDPDEQLFKMWYLGDESASFPNFATYYATSRDGIRWEKPLVGTAASALPGEQHNAVLAEAQLASVTKDASESDPARRYKLVCYVHLPKPVGGPHTYVSPDGLHWTRTSTAPICRSNDVITAWFDRRSAQWVALPKLSTEVRGQVRRCFGLSTSHDFLHWTEPRYVFRPDLRDDAGSLARLEAARPLLDRPDDPALMRTEFYGVGVYQHPSCVVAFPWVFTINNNGRYGNHDGVSEIQLAASRDLDVWERPLREPAVPLGKPGEWDCGFLVSSSEALRVGDEIRLYYAGANYTHGSPCLYRAQGTGRGTSYTSSIGLVRWKLDRFVSADGPAEGGTLASVPIVYRGSRLVLNAATTTNTTTGAGRIVVQLLDLDGRLLARSQPVTGDSLRHAVEWEAATSIAAWAGKPVVLSFDVQNAQLYSFTFGDR